MGIETAVVVGGLGIAKSIGDFNQSKSHARAVAHEGNILIDRRKKEIQQLAARQKIGYLNSGVELEGTAQAVIQDTYQTGIDDVSAIESSYAKKIKGMMTQARANLLGSLVQTGVNAAFMGSMMGSTALGGSAPQGALSSGGTYFGDGLFDLTNTATSGGNVMMTNASYIPRQPIFAGV